MRGHYRSALLTLAGLVILIFVIQDLVLTQSESITLPLLNIGRDKSEFDFELPDSNICRDIYLNLKAAVTVDNETGQVLYSYNAGEIRPIASISKLLTAMVVLDNYHPDSIMTITRADARRSARSLFRVGDRVRVKDLLHAALLQSDNRAARALARSVAGTYAEFAKKMNSKALALNLDETEMVEPTGLDKKNRSTAADCARLVNLAMKYPEIARITSLKKYEFKAVNRKRTRRLVNTNKMVYSKYKVLAGKTGYIIASDYCLTTILQNKDGNRITLVVLGAPGPNTRFREARRLANYSFRKIKRLTQAD